MEDEIRKEEIATDEGSCVTENEETSGGIGTGAAMLLGAALTVGLGAGGKKLYGWWKQKKEKKLKDDLEKVKEEDAEVIDSFDEEESE